MTTKKLTVKAYRDISDLLLKAEKELHQPFSNQNADTKNYLIGVITAYKKCLKILNDTNET